MQGMWWNKSIIKPLLRVMSAKDEEDFIKSEPVTLHKGGQMSFPILKVAMAILGVAGIVRYSLQMEFSLGDIYLIIMVSAICICSEIEKLRHDS